MSREDHHHEEELDEESIEQLQYLHPRIYEGIGEESVPIGFDAVTIHLDGRLQSDLHWKNEIDQAKQAVEKGYALMWNIEMGLFQGLTKPLTNQGQFLSLTLALEHFRDSIWKEFKSQTLGLTLFRGSADFSHGFHWDEHQEKNLRNWLHEVHVPHLAVLDLNQIRQHEEGKQWVRFYCRDVAIEYLLLLATRLPDALSAYLFLDTHLLPRSPLIEIQMLNPERFDRLKLGLRGPQLPFHAIGWGTATPYGYSGRSHVDLPDVQPSSVGICIPPIDCYHPSYYSGLDDCIFALQKKSISFRLIPESQLTAEWDGLDDLFYSPAGLTQQGKRKLQGFCAAGGRAVSTGSLIGLPNEITLADWLINLA